MLVVLHEADPRAAKTALSVLREAGHAAHLAGPEASAFELVYEKRPDLVILDLEAPARAAAETLRLIAGHPRLKGTPVLLRPGPNGEGADDLVPGSKSVRTLSKAAPKEDLLKAVRETRKDSWVVLVADDDPRILELLQVALEHEGHSVILAEEGGEAVVAAEENRPDVAVVDIKMPGLYGTAAVKTFRADPNLADIPVVFLTGVPLADARKLVSEDEATMILPKPTAPRVVLKAAREMVEARYGKRAGRGS